MGAPRLTTDNVLAAVTTVLRRSRGAEVRVDLNSRLDALGIESMDMIEILMVLEETTGCVIPDAELAAVETVADLAACETAMY
jgi:acyl carrier protein